MIKVQRQPVDVSVQIIAYVADHALFHERHKIGLQIIEHALEKKEHHNEQAQPLQGPLPVSADQPVIDPLLGLILGLQPFAGCRRCRRSGGVNPGGHGRRRLLLLAEDRV